MTNTVPRPHVTDPDGTHDSRYLVIGDPRAVGPEGPVGPQGPQGPVGPKGERGDDGQAVRIRWVVSSALDLPASNVNIGDGALVGAGEPYDVYVYANNPTPMWNNAGQVTVGPEGPTGPPGIPGPPGPQPPLAGTGSATTAARSDHDHDGIYSPASHTHNASVITSGILADHVIPDLSAGKFTSGTLNVNRLPDIPTSKITGTLNTAQVPNLDASKISSGTISVDRIPNLPASKITGGTFNISQIPQIPTSRISGTLLASQVPGLNANKITAGTIARERLPSMTLGQMFPSNATTTTGSSAMRVAPSNSAGVIVSPLGAGWGIFDSGYRQNTDENWAYVMVPGLGFGWIPANRI